MAIFHMWVIYNRWFFGNICILMSLTCRKHYYYVSSSKTPRNAWIYKNYLKLDKTIMFTITALPCSLSGVFLSLVSWCFRYLSGPFKINGVPICRVNQTYVIATSTKVDISGVDVAKFDDKYFAREKKQKVKKTEGELFETEKEVGVWVKKIHYFVDPCFISVESAGIQVTAWLQEGWPEGCGFCSDQGYRGCPGAENLSWRPVLSQGWWQAPWDGILSF